MIFHLPAEYFSRQRGPPVFYELLFAGGFPFGAWPGRARPSARETMASKQLFCSSGEENRSLFQRFLPSCPGNAHSAEAGRDSQHWSKTPSIKIIVSCLPPPYTLPTMKENTTVRGNTPRQINPRLKALPVSTHSAAGHKSYSRQGIRACRKPQTHTSCHKNECDCACTGLFLGYVRLEWEGWIISTEEAYQKIKHMQGFEARPLLTGHGLLVIEYNFFSQRLNLVARDK